MSFEIRAGEKISIVGMNGEGKTTMVKLLLGLFEPDSGRILIGGKPLQAYAREAREKIFGTVFQDFTRSVSYTHLDVYKRQSLIWEI